ncbi:MAG: hypothetical protein AVO33_08985 [delta proteobacterium ML8_F1]|nr:MAG: hypothetical protein AVO33_08985 [delta proteobacterium ML8_F1]
MPFEKLYIELTDACNLNCVMCYRHNWPDLGGHMSHEMLEKIIGELGDNPSLKEIVLGGIGEPTVHPAFKEILPRLDGYRVTVTTNGTTLDEDMSELFVRHVDRLVVSVDGSASVYDRIRGFEYFELLKNLQGMDAVKRRHRSHTPQLQIQMVVSKDNQKDIPAVIEMASNLGASELILSNMIPVTLEDAEKILYTQFDNREIYNYFQGIRPLAFRKGLELRITESRVKTDRVCRFVDYEAMVVNSLGEVTPCYRLMHSGEEVVFNRLKKIEKAVYGRVMEKTLLELWEDPHYVTFRNMVKGNRYPSCMDCDLVEGCDFVRSTAADCHGNTPSCADCLWSRNIIYCV